MPKIKAHLPVITTVDVPDMRVKDYLSSQNPPVTGSKEVSDPHRGRATPIAPGETTATHL